MYKMDTYFDQDRIPVLEKELVCEETGRLDSPDKITGFLNSCFRLNSRTEEYVYLIALDTKCKPIGIFELGHGTVNGSPVSPREVFMKALLCGACTIVLAHNHPSGDVTPSAEDLRVMNRIRESGDMLDVRLLDFIIVGNGYFSASEKGVLQ